MRIAALLVAAALALAGCGGGGSGPARERVEQAVKHCHEKQLCKNEAEEQRILGLFIAACKEAPNFVMHVPGYKDETCKGPATENAVQLFPTRHLSPNARAFLERCRKEDRLCEVKEPSKAAVRAVEKCIKEHTCPEIERLYRKR